MQCNSSSLSAGDSPKVPNSNSKSQTNLESNQETNQETESTADFHSCTSSSSNPTILQSPRGAEPNLIQEISNISIHQEPTNGNAATNSSRNTTQQLTTTRNFSAAAVTTSFSSPVPLTALSASTRHTNAQSDNNNCTTQAKHAANSTSNLNIHHHQTKRNKQWRTNSGSSTKDHYEHSQLSSAIVSIGMANDAENSKNQSAFRKIVHSQISQNNTSEKDRELEFDPEECPLREEEHIRYTVDQEIINRAHDRADDQAARSSTGPDQSDLPPHFQEYYRKTYNRDMPPLPDCATAHLHSKNANKQQFNQFSTAEHHFHRIQVSGDTFGVNYNELEKSAIELFGALALRERYLANSMQSIHKTTHDYLTLCAERYKIFEDFDRRIADDLINEEIGDDEDIHEDIPYHPPPGTLEKSPYKEFNPDNLFDNAGDKYSYKMVNGIFHVFDVENGKEEKMCDPPTLDQFFKDHQAILTLTSDGPLKTFCFRRLQYLESKFKLHSLLNEAKELAAQKEVPHRDFYNCRKVDNHIHASAAMNQKHLLRFIKSQMKKHPTREVAKDPKTGESLTLQQVVDELGINAYDLSVDILDVHADRNLFHRFDRFNAKYNPLGQSILREVFIKTDNHSKGVLFAQLMKEVCSDLEESKYQHSEMRLSIYGRSADEWEKLAKWAIDHDVYSDNNRWLIQIPRLYDIYRANGLVKNFAQILENIFKPLYEASINPKKYPHLATFLEHVVGFDSVDDESKPEKVAFGPDTCKPADKWTDSVNPPYAYYIFYTYANMVSLNTLRKERGMNTFTFRPHAGEAGSPQHLVSAFLTSQGINHGLLLRKTPVLQYLYYLNQIGIAMSPLSNNSLFLSYNRNPFPDYFARGLNVTLSTDDPLQFHFTKEALMEEYSIATQVYKLSSTDMCELAKTSVMISGFEKSRKKFWLGPKYSKGGVEGNDIRRTNVPDIRVAFREETLLHEFKLLAEPVMFETRAENKRKMSESQSN